MRLHPLLASLDPDPMQRYYRRSRWLAARWENDRIAATCYFTGTTALLSPEDAAVLSALGFWRDAGDLARLFPVRTEAELHGRLEYFHRLRFVRAAGDDPDPREASLAQWESWDPVASQFHLATRDVPYVSREQAGAILTRRQARVAPPPPLKHVDGPAVILPAFARHGAFPETLLARRSWRHFGEQPLTLEQFSNLAGLTYAVQNWAAVDGQQVPLKTSPSGGACHSIEVYWAVRSVAGLAPGLYHYGADTHALTTIDDTWSWERVATYFVGQPWFAGASAIALMTSVFARTQWKYRDPRAYRVILLEAGHLCQTFCLAATWMELAPFCSAALADSEIERDLRIDGCSEAVLYAAGVGARPAGTDWAPYPESGDRPATQAPSHARYPERQQER